MAIENGTKAETVLQMTEPNKRYKWMKIVLLLLRLAIIMSTLTAALVMGSNKQSISRAVAIVGTTTIFQTYTANFHQIPAFVFFIVANAIGGFYNLVAIALGFSFSHWKAFHVGMKLMDLAIFALVATGAAAATSMAELGKNGNFSARWSPICDRFGQFCVRGGLAIVASLIGALLLMILNAVSAISYLYS
ncbi:CASP-like protein 1B1 [Phalaenopsis equestris]|uniref:CASP-like protein 1B1 n=1 Tax=Phalaenopsis equestris TaxID=78828 RepID=UPI0009E55DFF|nr:CASP-like protein 1B1 [Phalaenopsis equestris]